MEGQDRSLDSVLRQHGYEGPDHVADAVPVVEGLHDLKDAA